MEPPPTSRGGTRSPTTRRGRKIGLWTLGLCGLVALGSSHPNLYPALLQPGSSTSGAASHSPLSEECRG